MDNLPTRPVNNVSDDQKNSPPMSPSPSVGMPLVEGMPVPIEQVPSNLQNENGAFAEVAVETQPEKQLSEELPSLESVDQSHPAAQMLGNVQEEPLPSVVDKRTQHEQLHSVSQSADQLTKEADDKEKEFIEHIEEIHGGQNQTE